MFSNDSRLPGVLLPSRTQCSTPLSSFKNKNESRTILERRCRAPGRGGECLEYLQAQWFNLSAEHTNALCAPACDTNLNIDLGNASHDFIGTPADYYHTVFRRTILAYENVLWLRL